MDYPTIAPEDIRPGIFRIGHEDYHAGDGISSSELKKVLKSPAHFLVEMEDSRPLLIGRAFHQSVLEPDLFTASYAVTPAIDRRTKVGKEAYAQWLSENEGKEALSPDEWEMIAEMTEAVYASAYWPRIREYDVELGVFNIDDKTGLLKKCKPDMLGDWIIDFKSTDDASHQGFVRSVIKYKYHLSAAYYQDIVNAQLGRRLPFLFIAVEKKPPYGVGFYTLPDDFIEVGRCQYRQALDTLAECMTYEIYPGYPEEIKELEIPGWGYR